MESCHLYYIGQAWVIIVPKGPRWVLDPDNRAAKVVLETNPLQRDSEVD